MRSSVFSAVRRGEEQPPTQAAIAYSNVDRERSDME
jgi:hypothetical protein